MTHELTIFALAFTLLASPARACGNGECDSPKTPPKNPPEVQVIKPGDGEPTAPYVRQYYTGPCEWWHGKIVTHTAFGFEPFEYRQAMAHRQCKEKLMKEVE